MKRARTDRFDRRLTLWPQRSLRAGLEGFLLHPVRNPRLGGQADAAKTFLLQARGVPHAHLAARGGKGVWRAYKNRGAAAWPTCRTGGKNERLTAIILP